MRWSELVFLVPLLLAIAMVFGATGQRSGSLLASIRHAFFWLLGGIALAGMLLHLVSVAFA